jgi:hypothetical protein
MDAVAQEIWDAYARQLDVSLGDFDMRVMSVQGTAMFETDWRPADA